MRYRLDLAVSTGFCGPDDERQGSLFDLGKFFNKSLGLERQYAPVYIHGEPMRCVVCRHDEFWGHNVQLHTPAATFFNFEFANRIAHCAVCANCGYVHFFIPTNTAPADAGEPG